MPSGGTGTSHKESSRRCPTRTSSSTTAKDKPAAKQPPLIATVGDHCDGCGRPGHALATCHFKTNPDFNPEGKWVGSAPYKNILAILKTERHPTWHPTLAYVRGNSKGTFSSSEQLQRQSSDTGVYGPQPCYERFGRLAHSEHSADDLEDRVVEAEGAWSFGLHCRISSDPLTAFITAQGLYQLTRVAMGLKGAGPY